LDPAPYECYVSNPHASAHCLDGARPSRGGTRRITLVGTYPPLPFLAPAAALRTQDDPLEAVRVGRVIAMFACLLLLGSAVWVLYDPEAGWLSLTGLVAACTPSAVFLAGSLSPSGLAVS